MSLIVVVDDQGSNQRIYSKLASLVEDDVQVETFGNPFDMLSWAGKNVPDLVITDYKMPGMDGANLTRRLHEIPEAADVPVIVLTAYEDRSFRLSALEAGATDFIQTPVNHEEFLSRARNLLKLRQQQQSIKRQAQVLESRLRHSEHVRERALRESHDQLAQVIDTVPALIRATDRDGRCVFVNAMFAVYAQKDPPECVGVNPSDLLKGSDVERNRVADEAVISRGQPLPSFEERLLDPSGTARSFLVTKSPLFDRHGTVIGVLTTSLDITEQKMAQERLRYLAEHDPLTGLPNRTYLSNRLQALVNELPRTGRLSALHLLDLDRFKSVNDTLGHYVGDQLLQAVSKLLKPLARQGTTLARLGGDEFALLQEGISGPEDASALAARIVDALAKPIDVSRHRVNTTVSVGTALVGRDGADVNEILKNADLAMYRAKNRGRNGFAFFSDDLRAKASESAVLEAAIRDGLARNEFVLFYQPQRDIATGRFVGGEALLRWQHPQRGLLAPNVFLPVAEETGLMGPLSEWVLREACRQLAEWHREGLVGFRMAINLSPADFERQNIWDMLEPILAETGIAPSNLELELTESVFVDPATELSERVALLKSKGISIALDDFGTGFSSLRLVRELPVNALKIDRSFVSNLPHSNEDAAIVRAIVRLGRGLGLRVVAEGVETAEQLAFLKDEECDEVQGYYFSRPVPSDIFLKQVLQQNSGDAGA